MYSPDPKFLAALPVDDGGETGNPVALKNAINRILRFFIIYEPSISRWNNARTVDEHKALFEKLVTLFCYTCMLKVMFASD